MGQLPNRGWVRVPVPRPAVKLGGCAGAALLPLQTSAHPRWAASQGWEGPAGGSWKTGLVPTGPHVANCSSTLSERICGCFPRPVGPASLTDRLMFQNILHPSWITPPAHAGGPACLSAASGEWNKQQSRFCSSLKSGSEVSPPRLPTTNSPLWGRFLRSLITGSWV